METLSCKAVDTLTGYGFTHGLRPEFSYPNCCHMATEDIGSIDAPERIACGALRATNPNSKAILVKSVQVSVERSGCLI